MQIKEIISFYVNEASSTLEVSFRLESDQEDEVREDFIELCEVEKFGYNFKKTGIDLFENEEFDENLFVDSDFEIEEDVSFSDVQSFISEYYLIFPEKLPSAQLF
ncbi:hypothetical protein EBU94_06810 [bacterium]|nr:hypothetical protein [bacterium]